MTDDRNECDIQNFLSNINPNQNVPDDVALAAIKNDIEKRQITYEKILESYSESIKNNLTFKCFSRFFTWALVTFVFISVSVKAIEILEKCVSIGIENQIPIALASLGSLLTVIIAIPKIIAEYIFNKEEDQYMVEILKNLLDFDRSMFK